MEEEIKNLLGENYHEGMTAQDVQSAFNKMLLSSGKYVNKDNAEAQTREIEKNLKAQIDSLNASLNSKMSDEEKAKAAQKARDDEFEEMKKLLAQTRLNSSKSVMNGNISEARGLSGIEAEDEGYIEFISSIVSEDEEKSSKVSKYINEMVKKAYEKGKSDSMKNGLGQMGKDGKGSKDDEEGSEIEAKVKSLAERLKPQNNSYYFK
ncbi:MAG: DUF4355 domain-containing protein [Bacteroidales bacterium]|nr:DUF4355 domain-containing protein [Candidatus Scybalousia scybalohippi]